MRLGIDLAQLFNAERFRAGNAALYFHCY